MQRPTGITILAILAAIAGVFGLFAAVALLGFGAAAGAGGMGLLVIVGLIALVYAGLSLALAYGFWTLNPWAWPLGVGVQVLGVIYAAGQYLNDSSQLGGTIVSLAIAAVILWYLFQPNVKAAFGRS